MRYQPLPPATHAKNRARLAKAIGPEAVAIIDTADLLIRVGDAEYPFRPDSNFYYLTGIDQPEAVLILVPGHPNPDLREILAIKQSDEFTTLWQGEGHSKDQAAKLSGIKTVLTTGELDRLLDRLLAKYRTIYLNADESLESVMPSPAKRRAAHLRRVMPLHELRSAIPQLSRQRTIKDPAEVAQIRRAVGITRAGLERAYAAVKSGAPEYAAEAELTAGFIAGGASGHAFNPIIAVGRNATIIHYMAGDSTIGANDLVLLDVGAEYGYYAADISRTIPVSGHFTPRQRAVYEAVYRVQQAGIALHKPGESIMSVDAHMRDLLVPELVKLGLITAAQAKSKDRLEHVHRYYPHISHHLGLDVHDTGDPRATFEPGMVVTCEPGLYIPEEGIGVRLEDDILITADGHEVLSEDIPSDPAAYTK